MSTLKTAALLTATIAASLTMSAASANPFAQTELSSGYMQVASADAMEGKCGEGKCGNMGSKKSSEGKCGDMGSEKTSEGKCGDMGSEKTSEGKCGEGKCGGMK